MLNGYWRPLRAIASAWLAARHRFAEAVRARPFIAIIFAVFVFGLPLLSAGINPNGTGQNQVSTQRLDKSRGEESIAIYTLWLERFTGVLAIATIGLWVVTERSLRHTRKAVAALERAFVHERLEVKPFQGIRSIEVILENSGATPTRNTIMRLNLKEFDEELRDDFEFPDYANPDIPTRYVPMAFGPKTQTKQTIRAALEMFRRVAKGETYVYLWGWVDYDDSFPGTQRHRTEYCYKLNAYDLGQGNLIGNFQRHHTFNGADDECYRAPAPYKRPGVKQKPPLTTVTYDHNAIPASSYPPSNVGSEEPPPKSS